jgi:hypothetical protein
MSLRIPSITLLTLIVLAFLWAGVYSRDNSPYNVNRSAPFPVDTVPHVTRLYETLIEGYFNITLYVPPGAIAQVLVYTKADGGVIFNETIRGPFRGSFELKAPRPGFYEFVVYSRALEGASRVNGVIAVYQVAQTEVTVRTILSALIALNLLVLTALIIAGLARGER